MELIRRYGCQVMAEKEDTFFWDAVVPGRPAIVVSPSGEFRETAKVVSARVGGDSHLVQFHTEDGMTYMTANRELCDRLAQKKHRNLISVQSPSIHLNQRAILFTMDRELLECGTLQRIEMIDGFAFLETARTIYTIEVSLLQQDQLLDIYEAKREQRKQKEDMEYESRSL